MLHTLTPLVSPRNVNFTAYRNPLKMRNIPVLDSPIILRDYASVYTIDLSDYDDDQELIFGIDTSATHQDRHEALCFEVVLIMPATQPPKVTFPFVDKWLDFAGHWRNEPGKTYLLSFFRLGGKWFGALNGTTKLVTKDGTLSRTIRVEDENETGVIPLSDVCSTYEYTVTEDSLTFGFKTDSLANEKSVLCFDLLLTIESDAPELTFPVTRWFDFCYPARGFKRGEKHALTFISLDGGETWVGRWNNYI